MQGIAPSPQVIDIAGKNYRPAMKCLFMRPQQDAGFLCVRSDATKAKRGGDVGKSAPPRAFDSVWRFFDVPPALRMIARTGDGLRSGRVARCNAMRRSSVRMRQLA